MLLIIFVYLYSNGYEKRLKSAEVVHQSVFRREVATTKYDFACDHNP